MKQSVLWSLAGLLLLAGGCASEPYAACPAGASRTVVIRSIEAMGGLGRWEAVNSIRTTAIVTVYRGTTGIVSQQRQRYDLRSGTLKARAMLPEGPWKATVHVDGQYDFDAKGYALAPQRRTEIVMSLTTLLHRAYGPLALCRFGPSQISQTVTDSQNVRISGHDYIRLGVKGGAENVKAYYLDPQTYLPGLVTVGGDRPGEVGTVTRYTYKLVANGLAFPAKVEVYNIGQDVLISDTPILEVDFRTVTAR